MDWCVPRIGGRQVIGFDLRRSLLCAIDDAQKKNCAAFRPCNIFGFCGTIVEMESYETGILVLLF